MNPKAELSISQPKSNKLKASQHVGAPRLASETWARNIHPRKFLLPTLAIIALTGCHSAMIAAHVENHTGAPVSLIEVDYPSQSFGRDAINAGANFDFRFKIIGSGPVSINWTDAAHHTHKSTGPQIHEGQHGEVTIDLTPTGAQWSKSLTP